MPLIRNRVRLDVDERGIAQVTLARAGKMNALDPDMFDAIIEAIDALRAHEGVRAVVLHGEGRAFCAGLDMASMSQAAGGAVGDLAPRTHGLANRWQQVAWGWRQLPVPVVAAVHGVAYGGGLQIALGADVRHVHPDARLSVMEIQWGLVPDMAGCVLLTELVRADVARDLVFTGRVVPGTQAVALGLATAMHDDPLASARAWALQIAQSSPSAIRAGKRLLGTASPVDAASVLLQEAQEQQQLIGGAHQAEAVRAAVEKRRPRFG